MEKAILFMILGPKLILAEGVLKMLNKTDIFNEDMDIHNIIDRIEKLNCGLRNFWSNCDGWAPIEAAELITKSRLDWQLSLSGTLRLWVKTSPEELTEGELILAWVNLGSLVEGTLKLFLSVHYNDYKEDFETLKYANAFDYKKVKPKTPDGLTLDTLQKFVKKKELLQEEHIKLIKLVQQRRNAVHAFQDKPIGNCQEFDKAVRKYLIMLRSINTRLPYPDGIYEPQEI